MTYKTIAGLIPTMQSVALVGENLKETKKKKPNLVKMGVNNIVGISLIGATSKLVYDL